MTLGAGGYYGRQNWYFQRNVDGWVGTVDLTCRSDATSTLPAISIAAASVGGFGGGIGQRFAAHRNDCRSDDGDQRPRFDGRMGAAQVMSAHQPRIQLRLRRRQSVRQRTTCISAALLLLWAAASAQYDRLRELHLAREVEHFVLGRIPAATDVSSGRRFRPCQSGGPKRGIHLLMDGNRASARAGRRDDCAADRFSQLCASGQTAAVTADVGIGRAGAVHDRAQKIFRKSLCGSHH